MGGERPNARRTGRKRGRQNTDLVAFEADYHAVILLSVGRRNDRLWQTLQNFPLWEHWPLRGCRKVSGARFSGVADVSTAVRFARDTGLLVAVWGGWHSFTGLSVCDGGLLIDLSPMKGIRVDPEARTVTAQAGVLL